MGFSINWLPAQIVTLSYSQKIPIPFDSPLFHGVKRLLPDIKPQKKRTIIELLGLAERYKTTLGARRLTMSELAKEEGITRARMTQIMNLLKLAPEIREYIRNLNDPEEIEAVCLK